jgi:hypothetical protein
MVAAGKRIMDQIRKDCLAMRRSLPDGGEASLTNSHIDLFSDKINV